MAGITDIDPPISPGKYQPHPTEEGEYILNIPACIQIAKGGETPQAQELYRRYRKEYWALQGQPITHERREQVAFKAAAESMGWQFAPSNNF